MEIAIWAFIVFVLVALFKTLKYEKSCSIYNEKQLLKRYFEIKKINPDYRVSYLRDWESHAVKAIEDSYKPIVNRVVHLKSVDDIK
jgi:hypothetical protein